MFTTLENTQPPPLSAAKKLCPLYVGIYVKLFGNIYGNISENLYVKICANVCFRNCFANIYVNLCAWKCYSHENVYVKIYVNISVWKCLSHGNGYEKIYVNICMWKCLCKIYVKIYVKKVFEIMCQKSFFTQLITGKQVMVRCRPDSGLVIPGMDYRQAC